LIGVFPMLKLKQSIGFIPDTSSLGKDILLASAEYPRDARA